MLTENIKHIKDVLVLEKQQKKKQLKKILHINPVFLGNKNTESQFLLSKSKRSLNWQGEKKLLLFCV